VGARQTSAPIVPGGLPSLAFHGFTASYSESDNTPVARTGVWPCGTEVGIRKPPSDPLHELPVARLAAGADRRELLAAADGDLLLRRVGRRQRRRAELGESIARVHEANRGVYGSPRVCAALRLEGRAVCRNTVAKIMKERGIRARTHRRFRVRTTDADHRHPIASNVLARRFSAEKPDRVWLADITYIPTDEGWLYLAGVMDLCSRRIVGWSMAEHLGADLVRDALDMAIRARRPGAGLLHHSDRGVQYACAEYRRELEARGVTISMSRAGDCYDNAPQESFWGKLKTELVHLTRFATHRQARAAIFEYIECFYNRTRLHSSLGYLSPVQFEESLRR
jgi:putative transposase